MGPVILRARRRIAAVVLIVVAGVWLPVGRSAADDAAAMEFSAGDYVKREDQTEAVIVVTRTAALGTSSVWLTTADGTAEAGSDYAAVAQLVEFKAGQRARRIAVPLIDDPFPDGDETVVVSLTAPTGGQLGLRATATLTITDDERVTTVTDGGALAEDTTWKGGVLVNGYVTVPEGITLTIKPGTNVWFRGWGRDYRNTRRYTGILVDGGTLRAVGDPDEPIWFTSAEDPPMNGDWAGITVEDSDDSLFSYVVVEFAGIGIEQFDSAVPVTHSLIRWNNTEGLYAERSSPRFESNLLYGNAYHEIALEQYNTGVEILDNVFRGGHRGVHFEETTALVEGNLFTGYTLAPVTLGQEANVTVRHNRFDGIDRENAIFADASSTLVLDGNDFDGVLTPPQLDFADTVRYALPYVPADPDDAYPYVYASEDETRRVLQRLGAGQNFGWSLVYADGYLWRFPAGYIELLRIDPVTGETTSFDVDGILNPRGLTWDGHHFWVNDFSLLQIIEFHIDGDAVAIDSSFPIPEAELGGTSGLTWDGSYLNLLSRDGSKVYRLTTTGLLVESVSFDTGVFNDIVWTGSYFWARGGCPKGICRFTYDGELVGEIYPAADETWAIAWDGSHLWTVQRTCELWADPKVYEIEVLDDSLGAQTGSSPED